MNRLLIFVYPSGVSGVLDTDLLLFHRFLSFPVFFYSFYNLFDICYFFKFPTVFTITWLQILLNKDNNICIEINFEKCNTKSEGTEI